MLLVGCSTANEENEGVDSVNNSEVIVGSEEYAKNFYIDKSDSIYTRLMILSPWQEKTVLNTYYLVKNDSVQIPSDGVKIKVPIQSIAVNSCSHVAYIDALGKIKEIVGVTDSEAIYNENFRNLLAEGSVVDLGGSYDMNIEKVLNIQPDILMITGFEGVDNTAMRLESAGVNVVYNYEWVEQTVLGRAEWIKVFGELFDCRELADSIFYEIETEYIACSELAKNIEDKPKLMSGTPYKGIWYVPGGQTFMAEFYRTSGLDYFYDTNKDNFSLALSLEAVMNNFLDADIWVGVDVETYEQLDLLDERLMLFGPVKKKKVYHHLKRVSQKGGNDFWESAMLRPDILLKDFIRIAHPELLPDWELYYLGEVE